jgi:hypothetical protein
MALECNEEPGMPKTYWITAEITRRAFMKLEAEDQDEARAMAEQLVEEGAFQEWEEDIPDVIVEEILEGTA